MKQGLILSYTQLFMLAAAQGSDVIAGLPKFTPDTAPEKLFAQVKGLTEAGLIVPDGDSFVCSPEGAEIGRRLGSAESFILFRSNQRDLPDFSCYPGSELMLCTPSMIQKDKASVRFVTMDELLSILLDEGYIADVEEQFEPDDEELTCFEMQIDRPEPGSLLPEDGSVMFSAEKIRAGKNESDSVTIVSYYYFHYMIERVCGKTRRLRFSPAAVRNALKGMVSL